MKRPEGFNRPEVHSASGKGKSHKPKSAQSAKTETTGNVVGSATPPRSTRNARQLQQPDQPKQPKQPKQSTQPTQAQAEPPPAAGRELRKAAAARRRYERGEVRRFTRRSRRRRISVIVVAVCFLLLGGLVTGAIYSPVLSLRAISIVGTSRVDKGLVLKAVGGQIGTPLALLDFGVIRRELSAFPLIRSYVTESQPPDTLVIRIVERAPIALVQTAKGFSVVDPAGVVLQDVTERPVGLPELTGSASLTDTAAFAASVDVLLALPADIRAKVDSITAATRDNVTLSLSGGKIVLWGSDEQSALKGAVLAALISSRPEAVRYDVTAPTVPVVADQ